MKHLVCTLLAFLGSIAFAYADHRDISDYRDVDGYNNVSSQSVLDDDAQLRLLAKWVQNARGFDNEFTREKVYLHLDNSAYFEDETIWFKAYVMRASTLCADTALSHVLYVDLLDSRGETIEQKLIHIDEQGQGEGSFDLRNPVRSGYYELRAYTRAMTNWGADVCFSRVIPVFKGAYREKLEMQASIAAQNGAPLELDFEVPMPEDDRNLVFGAHRPIAPKATAVNLTFFPEGGNRVGGVEQRIAFQLTGEGGRGLAHTVSIRRADGSVIAETTANAEGMGRFTLPADIPATETLYAITPDKRFTLPTVVPQAQYALEVDKVRGKREEVRGDGEEVDDDEVSYEVHIRANADRQRLLGLLVSCRARPCYFDTIHVYAHDDIVMTLDAEVLHDGVNSIDLFDEDGHSLCRRLVWKQPEADRTLELSVLQNEAKFSAFSPIALDLSLNDCEGYAVPDATFSVSVRNADADVVASPAVDLTTELLLSSELRGYIHRPEQYCAAVPDDEAAQRAAAEAIDLLLLVQGWSAEAFETLAGARPFDYRQPIEDRLTLDGTVYRDNDKRTPYPGLNLHLQMYTREGASLEAFATTDEQGRFAFESAANYCGEWIAQFITDETTTNLLGAEVAKKRWSRIALNRWFAPKPRPFYPGELEIKAPTRSASSLLPPPAALMEWTDTIQRVLINRELGEAVAVHHNGYRGLVGNRYTYNGGEAAALRRPSFYINVGRENERRKDAGLGEGTLLEIIAEAIDRKIEFTVPTATTNEAEAAPNTSTVELHELDSEQPLANSGTPSGKSKKKKSKKEASTVELTGASSTSDFEFGYHDFVNTNFKFDHPIDNLPHAIQDAPELRINNRDCVCFLNNELIGWGYGGSLNFLESELASDFKSVVIMPDRNDWMRFWPVARESFNSSSSPYTDGRPYYGVFLYERPDAFRYFTKKGVDKRIVQGYSIPRKFYTPQYNGTDEPTLDDFRRTLCWRPNVTTDSEGHASVVFFNDATEGQRITISVRGITSNGNIICFDR